MEPFVSVVVPTFNRRASLRRLLEALAAQTYPAAHFEVVVVDDGSTDGTVEWLQGLALPYGLRLLRQPHQGPAQARNLGVMHARGALVLFLDDDVVPVPDLIAAHGAGHEAEQDMVVVGPMSPPRDWPRPAWIRWEEEKLQVQYRALLAGKYPCTPRQFYTANASLSRARFLEAGGFDPAFQRAEDVELAYRLRDRGARFAFNPRAEVLHYAARSFESWCRTPYQYGRYDVAMHRDKGQPTLSDAALEFHGRHPLNRVLARLCVGRPLLLRGAVLALSGVVRASDCLGSRSPAGLALSGIFHLLYWQGVSDELGGPEAVWRWIAGSAPGAVEVNQNSTAGKRPQH
ncbi:MAG: glycosyltransferase [Chloroflexi bacterium]|nr:glycosyltransferase [Chloroflexota bacterium]